MSSTGRRILPMAFFALLSLLAQPEVDVDAPSWAPIVFAVGAFAVVVLVLVLVRQKMKQSELRSDNPEDPESREQDPQN